MKRAFSLVELMVAVAISGIVTAAATTATVSMLPALPDVPITQSFNVTPGALDRTGALFVGGFNADGDVLFKMAPGAAAAEVLYRDSDNDLMLVDIPYSFLHFP